MEIAFGVLRVIGVRLRYHLSNLEVQLNTAEKENVCSVTLHQLSLISVFSCIVAKSAWPLSNSVFFFLYSDVNGIVNIAATPGVPRPPGGVSKATKCDRNEGALGDWFLLRG